MLYKVIIFALLIVSLAQSISAQCRFVSDGYCNGYPALESQLNYDCWKQAANGILLKLQGDICGNLSYCGMSPCMQGLTCKFVSYAKDGSLIKKCL
jgi:hypothetical protein